MNLRSKVEWNKSLEAKVTDCIQQLTHKYLSAMLNGQAVMSGSIFAPPHAGVMCHHYDKF